MIYLWDDYFLKTRTRLPFRRGQIQPLAILAAFTATDKLG